MVEVQRTTLKDFNKVTFIGKKYDHSDRNEFGSFAPIWEEWNRNNWFELIEEDNELADDAAIGLIILKSDVFEYWIGQFFIPGAIAPYGFEEVSFVADKVGYAEISGNPQNGELYGDIPLMMSWNAIKQCEQLDNYQWNKEESFERYDFDRFSTSKEATVLGYGFLLEKV
ncbi:hypothetical protein [Pediococcus claussenii]|uniref:Uncharacterized protein n=1 Tax=Pediococcus claussenii (strain ATCC BAA-344 / DSM 14800 / JCM 18046 / KCTC 3811 / LMG 21948 / P06) TaxID=701521 RepID=G8PC91_PEDCP|nr:hypothetical protein [Pediococcus claussenii]AEV96069.1 hypothetical protein PECL_1857 [Pediococcus claussenii ATCC BAA-344]ANZ69553.1 hypothetical protein AYR57_04150 [Pediococcus claussenii]ANZ71370.1 hypothetical protein AYR58_04155 [Pediococcus claussenii]KRN19407.1 hypothetical protein IV79_GL001459 [Pediococcus claussenii]